MNIQELTKTYDGKTVVDSVSFEISKGKVLSLIGPNGAGKSTVMGMISRLIARDEGMVDFHGKDIGKWKSRELSKKLAILTQSNQIQMKLTVQELVAFGRFPYSGNRITKEDQEIIDQAIAYMELEDMRDRFIDELSGGQRQRLTIARALVRKPEILILDDSSSALDYATDAALRKELKSLPSDVTVFLVSQRTSSIRHADHILVLEDGKAAGWGTHEELLESCEIYREIYESQYGKGGRAV